MNTEETHYYEKFRNGLDSFNPHPPPAAEPIYDLTTSDQTDLVKAAGPIERGEKP
jgi:hypothetical protein